jgi:hypothetical protein
MAVLQRAEKRRVLERRGGGGAKENVVGQNSQK